MSRNYHNPISWIPTVYFAMGLPFVVLNMVSVLMFKGLGAGFALVAFALNLPFFFALSIFLLAVIAFSGATQWLRTACTCPS